jgi:hypothetical protein
LNVRRQIIVEKPTKILTTVFLALLVSLVAGVVAFAVVGKTLDKESKAFVDAAIPAIVSDWDAMEIKKRASPEFDETINYEDLQQLLDILRGLGEMEEYRGSTGQAQIVLSFEDGVVITAVYEASADFEAGSADMLLSLIKHGGQWQILGFKINPEELHERKDII